MVYFLKKQTKQRPLAIEQKNWEKSMTTVISYIAYNNKVFLG